MNYSSELRKHTFEFNQTLSEAFDLIISDPEIYASSPDKTTVLDLGVNGNILKLRFDWCDHSVSRSDFVTLITEDMKLFFGARFFWGMIDLLKLELNRIEFWNFYQYKSAIVVLTELEAQALTLSGLTIDKVPIDPPYDSKDFEDRIEFDSPTYGHQVLRLI